MMGSGKTTVGRLLAERTGWPFHDNDALLERATGQTALELLATRDEAALRAAETDALWIGLDQSAPCIVAAAAGTITDPANRELLAEPLVVWLESAPHLLAWRARGGAHRPWLETDPVNWMRAALAERAALYRSVADLRVDCSGNSPPAVASEILDWLSASGAYHRAR